MDCQHDWNATSALRTEGQCLCLDEAYPYPLNPPRIIVLNFAIFFGLITLPLILGWWFGW